MTISDLKARIADLPNCKNLLDVWLQWRGPDFVPIKQNARPEDLGPAMSGITIFELGPDGELFIRLLATNIQERIIGAGAGGNLLMVTDETERQTRMQRYQKVINDPCAMLAKNRLVLKSGLTFELDVLVLPIKDREEQRNFAYTATDIWEDTRRLDREQSELAEIPIANDVTFFDLSH